ncbi:hypothetical protein DY000_02054289 [Brassica cretica]|uniref:Uncharacterized protein n=1 Tax=Brassica cretica TaxID=69181 RepID=A0ABQ7AGD0_BRACR|nr:hypothetical protein DY000_02054289 [Brassica cretica]
MAAHTKDTMHAEEYDEDYEEERATEYGAILDEEDKLLHHSSWKRNVPSIDRSVSTSIDTHSHQTSQKRASTDIAYYPSIDTGVDRVREGDYLIGSWGDDHHHESYAVETAIHEPEADEPLEGFTYEELLKMQRRDEVEQYRAEAIGERSRFSHPIDRANPRRSTKTLHHRSTSGPRWICKSNRWACTARIQRGHCRHFQMANGADNLFIQQRTIPTHQQRVTKDFYDTAGGIVIYHGFHPLLAMDDLEESGDFGVFWSLLSVELHRRVRCLAMDGDLPTDILSPSFDIRYIFELDFQCHRFEVNQHHVAEVMPGLLKSCQSASREEAVEGMKDCRSTKHPCH